MGIIRFAINNPVKVVVGVILLSLFGLLSIFYIPIQLTPNVDEPRITVTTRWEGASPQEIEREIVERQEEKLKGVSDLRKMTSTSVEGEAVVVLEFFVGVDKDAALRDVSDKLRQVTAYPDEVDEPTVQAADASLNTPIAWLIFFTGEDEDAATLKDFVEDEVKPLLERAQGVASVDIYGGREREVQIRVDAAKMAARGITFRELEAALRRQNKNISAGTITSGKRDYTWRTLGQFETTEQVEDTVIAHREGGPVYVRDIATVVSTHKKQYSFVRSFGRHVLALPIRRETGSNVIEVMNHLKVQIEKVNREILGPLNRGFHLEKVYDETIYIHAAIDLVINNLFFGGTLAIIVLILFLRSTSATAIIALCIPISVVGSFLVVTLLGRTLNVVMLAGMAFAVGMVVDNSIVVLENIYRHHQMGKDRVKAALEGALEVWGAVLASTLTTLAVFLPVIFIQEEAGQLFRDIAIAISSAVGLSLVVAMTVIPTVSARYLRAGKKTQRAAGFSPRNSTGGENIPQVERPRRLKSAADYISNWVHRINGSIRARLTVSGVLIGGSLLGSYLLMAPTDYLPSGNQNMIFGFLITPPGYSLDEFLRMGEVIENTISPYWNTELDSPQAKANAEKWMASVVPGVRAKVTAAEQRLVAAEAALKEPQQPAPNPGHDPSKEVRQAEEALKKARENLKSHMVPPPPIANFFYVAWGGQCFMGAMSRDENVVKPLTNLLSHAGSRVPGVFPIFIQASLFGGVGGSGNSIELEIRGDDLNQVSAAAEQLLVRIMNRFDFPRPDPANFNLGRPEIQIVPDRVRAAEVGLNVRDIGFAVEACVDGAFVPGGFRQHGDEIDLTILVQGTEQATPEEIAQVPLYTPVGQIVPLGSFVNIVKTTAPQQINHIEEMPSVTLIVRPEEDMALETAMQILEDDIITPMREQGTIPKSVYTIAAGNADKLVQTRRALFGAWHGLNWDSLVSLVTSRGFIAIFITYLLMAALFESFAYPFVIMFTVVPATVGGFAGLRIVHTLTSMDPTQPIQKLDVLTMLGFVILVGIVVNNAILIVHQALNYMREGLPPREAITESVRSRVRPIFMTALTSICGMLPLVVMPGAGSELYRGLGSVVVGGLLISTVFTLLLVPAMFSLFVDLRQWIMRTTVVVTPHTSPSEVS